MGVVLDIEVHHGAVIEAPTSKPLRVVSASKSLTPVPLSSANRLYVRGDAVGRAKLTVTDGDETWTYRFRVSPDVDGTDEASLAVERGRSLLLEPPDAATVVQVMAGDDAVVRLERLLNRVHVVGRAVGETDLLIERKGSPVQVYAVDVATPIAADGKDDVLAMAVNHSVVIETPVALDAARIADGAVGAYAQVYANLAVVSGRSQGVTDLLLLLHADRPPKFYRVAIGPPEAHSPEAKVLHVGGTLTWSASRPGGLVWVGGLDVAMATLIDGAVTVRGLQPGATDVVELYADGPPVFTEIEVLP